MAEHLTTDEHTIFPGFSTPQSSAYPDQAFDELMAFVSPAQWKIVCYIMRRTFGFKKNSDTISLDQICHGIIKRDGTRLDHGTGLAKSTVVEAIYGVAEQSERKRQRKSKRGLIEMGVLCVTKNLRGEKWNAPNTYRLRFVGEPVQSPVQSRAALDALPSETDTPAHEAPSDQSANQTTPGSTGGLPLVRESDTQEHRTVLQPTVLQPDRPDKEVEEDERNKGENKQPWKTPSPPASPYRGGLTTSAELLKEKREQLAQLKAASATHALIASQKPADGSVGGGEEQRPTQGGQSSLGPVQPRLRSARITVLGETIGKDLGERKINSLISQIHDIWAHTSMEEAMFLDWLLRVHKDVKDRIRSGQQIARPPAYFMSQLKREVGLTRGNAANRS